MRRQLTTTDKKWSVWQYVPEKTSDHFLYSTTKYFVPVTSLQSSLTYTNASFLINESSAWKQWSEFMLAEKINMFRDVRVLLLVGARCQGSAPTPFVSAAAVSAVAPCAAASPTFEVPVGHFHLCQSLSNSFPSSAKVSLRVFWSLRSGSSAGFLNSSHVQHIDFLWRKAQSAHWAFWSSPIFCNAPVCCTQNCRQLIGLSEWSACKRSGFSYWT